MPEILGPEAALAAQFTGPVIHTADFATKVNELLSSAPVAQPDPAPDAPSVVVVGGGKSAQELVAPQRYFAAPL